MSSSSPEPELTAGLSIHADPGAARADDVRQLTGNLTIGVRLLCSATAFLFISFLFAFFYLRAVNSNGLWRPKGVEPVQSWGIAVVVLMILAAVVFDVARRTVVAGTEPRWRGDGKEIFYIAQDGTATAVEVSTGTGFQIGSPKPMFKVPAGVLFWDVLPDSTRFLMPVPQQ